MKLKSFPRSNKIFSKRYLSFWEQNSKLFKSQHNAHARSYSSVVFNNSTQNYLIAAGVFAVSAGACYFWAKSKTRHELDIEPIIEAVYSLQAGDVDAFACKMANLAKNNQELEAIIYSLESENFYLADQLAKILFINKLSQKETYYIIKGIILAAYAEVQFESNSSATSSKCNNEVSQWYFDALGCFMKVMVSDKNKGLQFLALTHHNRLINHLKYRYSDAALSKLDAKIDSNMPLMTKILTRIQTIVIGRPKSSIEDKKVSNIEEVYSKLKSVIKKYWRLSDDSTIHVENRVTIRVWDRQRDSEVGHVSLETSKYYVSHWSEVKLGERTLLDDIIGYQRLPDTRVSLYTLDVDKIHKTYNDFRRSNCQWDIFASSVLSSMSRKNSQNCSGLTAVLLKVGGIENLASFYWHPFKDLLIDSAIVGGTIIWILISIAGVAQEVKGDVVNTRQNPVEVGRLMKESIERQKKLTLIKDIFFMLTGFGVGVWGLYSTYNVVFNDIPRLLGYGLVTHPEHIKILVENAQKFEFEKMQRNSNKIANKM